MAETIKRDKGYSRKTHKRCIKCREWKLREPIVEGEGAEIRVVERAGFGAHDSSSDGLQSICHTCKNSANSEARNRNVSARLRHHISTRCLTQLGEFAPEGFTRDLEKYLGYTIKSLVKHLRADLKEREGEKRSLRNALNEGYHVDHIHPLHAFRVIADQYEPTVVDWDEFQRCWRIENLSAIPASENLAKGGKILMDTDTPNEEDVQNEFTGPDESTD